MPNKSVSPELVAETVRFCADALRRKVTAIEQAAQSDENPEDALWAISNCVLTDSLMTLAQDPLRRAANGEEVSPGAIEDALDGFGAEADPLRVLLHELDAMPRNVVQLFSTKAQTPR